jgi:hypothetical protein
MSSGPSRRFRNRACSIRFCGTEPASIHPRIGAGLAPLLHLQMRAIEATEIERMSRRLTKLESRSMTLRRRRSRGAQTAEFALSPRPVSPSASVPDLTDESLNGRASLDGKHDPRRG